MGGGAPRTICSASSTAASANRRLWETTTMPIIIRSSRVEHSRSRFEQQGRRGGAGILMADAALTEVAGPALSGHHRNRGVPTGLRGPPRVLERLCGRRAGVDRGVERLECRVEAVEHRLVTELGPPSRHDAVDPGAEGLD